MNLEKYKLLEIQLRKIIIQPIAAIGVVITILITLFSYNNLAKNKNDLSNLLLSETEKQINFISEDIYFHNNDAIKRRLTAITESAIRSLSIGTDNVQTCRTVYDKNMQLLFAVPENCKLPHSSIESKITANIGNEIVGYVVTTLEISNYVWLKDLFLAITLLVFVTLVLMFLQFVLLRKLNSQIVLPLIEEISDKSRHETISNMTRMIAHDVRRPISLATMGVNVLENMNDPGKLKEFLPVLKDNVNKAASEVEGMLKDILYAGEQIDTRKEQSDPLVICRNTIHQMKYFFKSLPDAKKNIKINFSNNSQQYLVGSEHRWTRVLVNLLENAIHAMRTAGKINVNFSESSTDIQIKVSNENSFMTEEQIKMFFDKGFSNKGSTGLGSAIIQSVIKNVNGTIECKSDALVGTSFIITVPKGTKTTQNFEFVVETADINEIKSEVTTDTSSSIDKKKSISSSVITTSDLVAKTAANLEFLKRQFKILIIDDEKEYLTISKQTIENLNGISNYLTIFTAASFEESVILLENTSFDLVISDLNLNDAQFSGRDIVSLCSKKYPESRICVNSNDMSPSNYRDVLELGADWFLPKPIINEQMLRIILETSENILSTTSPIIKQSDKQIIILDTDKIMTEILTDHFLDSNLKTKNYSKVLDLKLEISKEEAANSVLLVSKAFAHGTELADLFSVLRFHRVIGKFCKSDIDITLHTEFSQFVNQPIPNNINEIIG
jgi:signal transduction histidine kinase/DNA-binding NarL/FixJ family response regulator